MRVFFYVFALMLIGIIIVKKKSTGRSTRSSLRESGILGFGIRITMSSRNPDPANDLDLDNPNSPDKKSGIQFLESGIDGVEFAIQDCLGFPYMRHVYCSTVLNVRLGNIHRQP